MRKYNCRNTLTDRKLQNIDFLLPSRMKEIIQGVLKIKIRWPLQKYNMMRAFKFHRLNVAKSLIFSPLVATQCHLAFVTDVLPLSGSRGRSGTVDNGYLLAHCASILFPGQKHTISLEGCRWVSQRVKLFLNYSEKL